MTEHEKTIANLLAENAALKVAVIGWAKAVDDNNYEHHGEIFTDSFEAANEELESLSPKTDELLNDVRKEGVRLYAEYLKENGLIREAVLAESYLNPSVKSKNKK